MDSTKCLSEQFIDKYKQLEMEIKRYYGKKAKEKGNTEIY